MNCRRAKTGLSLTRVVMRLCAVCVALWMFEVHAQDDPTTARKQYYACQEKLTNGQPCAALNACEKGLAAQETKALKELRSEARKACEEKRFQKKLQQPCEDPRLERTPKSQGECCWPDQSFVNGACAGIPTACPEGYAPSEDECVLVPCEPGFTHVDGVHCCRPGQLWSESEGRCRGIPSECPEGQEPVGEQCEDIFYDEDGDTIADAEDACPSAEEDFDGFEDGDGCPDFDNDGDGICDPGLASLNVTPERCRRIDPCPDDAEDFDNFEDSDGCPEPDNDRDTIPDLYDRCPNLAGESAFEGCLPPDRTLQILGWSSVALGGVGLISGTSLWLSAQSQRAAVDGIIQEAAKTSEGLIEDLTEREAVERYNEANTSQTTGVVLLSVGGLFVATGATLLVVHALTTPEPHETTEERGGLEVWPQLGPDTLGVWGRLRF